MTLPNSKTASSGWRSAASREDDLVHETIKKFPPTFGLKAFPGASFRLSESASFVDDSGRVKLYTQKWAEGQWLDFAKGTEEELRPNITEDPNL